MLFHLACCLIYKVLIYISNQLEFSFFLQLGWKVFLNYRIPRGHVKVTGKAKRTMVSIVLETLYTLKVMAL